MSNDLGEMYQAARLRISALVEDIDDDIAARPVASTPGWTVHDVVAHVTGLVVDVLAGNIEGAASDPWTAGQVARNVGRPVADMVREWTECAPGFEAFLSSPAGESVSAAVIDLHCHEADLCHALGVPAQLPDDFLQWVAPMMLEGFHRQVDELGLPPVSVDAAPFEVFRSRLGRRTVDEVRNLGWSTDPTPYVDAWFVFGRADQTLAERP